VSDASAFDRCIAGGGLVVFPADTVYGIACDPGDRFAVTQLGLLKRRSPQKPSAVMFFDPAVAWAALPELGQRTRAALSRLLPGGVTALVGNPAGRFPLACGGDPSTLGLRVVQVAEVGGARGPVLQSSANRAGGVAPQRLSEVPELIRSAAELVIDGGDLPGTPSTIVDLRHYEASGSWSVARVGAVAAETLERALGRVPRG